MVNLFVTMEQRSFTETPISYGRGMIGRGMRGVLGVTPIPFPTESPFVVVGAKREEPPELEDVSTIEPLATDYQSPRLASTPSQNPLADPDLAGQMGSIVQMIGQQLADTVLSHLSASSPVDLPTTTPVRSEVTQQPESSDLQAPDIAHVQFIPQRKVKEPPTFRGESSDTVTIEEWEDIMRNYLKKVNIKTEEQAEEMLVYLRGRARDVVKFGIRNSNIDEHKSPDAIYGMLKKHFSSSQYSSIPLADFYTTLPKAKEESYEYWLRLHRAADIASECLKEQGKTLDNPSTEVTRMFIRNCPDKDLALTFRSKPIDKWTATEVQDVLNEYHSEASLKASTAPQKANVAVNNVQVSAVSPVSPTDKQEPQQVKSPDHALERVLDVLERVLLQRSGRAQSSPRRAANNKLPMIEGLNDKPCRVCSEESHSTLAHCRDNKLCFQCFSAGHPRHKCPVGKRTAPVQQGE